MKVKAYYVMVKLQYGQQPAFFHPAFECVTKSEAEDVMATLPLRYGEIDRCVAEGKASGDYRELRPC